MNLSAIFSKTGKGVQEASGKTSHLSRADRSVLSAIDGKTSLAEVQKKFEKLAGPKFEALIQQLDKDGFIREVSSGASQQPAAPVGRTPPPPPRAAPPKAPAADSGEDSGLDFTQAIKVPPKAPAAAPKAPTLDLAAASRAEAERKAKEQEAFDYKARQEAEAKAQAEAKAREAAAHARARAEAEAAARAEAEAKTRAEADAKVKAAREAAVRMATEAKAKAGAADRDRQAAEERARKEAEDKARLEAELNAKLAEERKAREEAERRASEAAERARRELEEKARRDAEEMRQRLEAEMKAKLEEERKAREAEDRKRREEEDRKRREEDERRRKEDEARRAKEEAERKAREEEDRKRREEDERRRKADEERRAKEEAERRARREEEERRAKEEGERRAREEQDRKRRREEDERREKEEAQAKSRAAQPAPPPPAAPPPAAGGDIGDSLLADLESFSQREEEESKAKEEAARKAKEEAARRAREEEERQAKEEADRKRREEEERRRKEEEERRAREEAERQAREEEARVKQEEADRKRKAKESLAAKAAARPAAAADDDIGVTEDDLDMDDVKRDHKVLAKAAKKPDFEQGQASAAAAARPVRRPVKWGKPAAIALFVLLVGGVGLLNVMPVSTSDYEKAASDAMGVPVKIGSARLAALAGIEVRFENVSIGDSVKIRLVRGSPEIGSLFGGRKAFSRMELEGASISQEQLAGALLGKVAGENFRVERIVLKQAKFDGPLALPALDVEADIAGDGAVKSVTARGGDKLVAQLSPMGSDFSFEISAGSVAIPFVPALTLSDFGWKGTANRGGVAKSVFDGRVYEGVISGTAKIRWGGSWSVDGELKARGIKVAVFAPALVSEGKIEGNGNYAMSGTVPASLYESAKLQGDFKIDKGVLGSFNLTRALQSGGAQSTGRTEFSELTGQAVYDKGAIQIRNASLSAGAMNAGVSLDIDAGGGLAGRVAADVKTPTQTLRATLSISGKITDPVVRK